MFLVLLLCLLPVTKGNSCFRCWPELPALLEYDLQVLWGSPGPPTELSQRLRSLFLDDNTLPVPGYLARDHLEEETAAFFTHLDHSIKKLRDDKPALLDDVHVQMGLLAERLMERSQELTQKACNESCDLLSPMEVTACADCQMHSLSCNDPTVCTDKSVGTYKWAVILVSILLALAVAAIWEEAASYLFPEEYSNQSSSQSINQSSFQSINQSSSQNRWFLKTASSVTLVTVPHTKHSSLKPGEL
ncbi:testis-expressed protein 51 [Meriones unguiculatus]|uniref:testis-expressed protein 51 n=1 Tax=Meriones unguiculatus TaxID=10047 RepID=UPI00293F6005|nr:testis-expressed protein 51 [Meriones unguiculatus]